MRARRWRWTSVSSHGVRRSANPQEVPTTSLPRQHPAGAWVQDAPPSATPELIDGAWVTAGPTKRKQGRQVRDLDRMREREFQAVDALREEFQRMDAARGDDGEEALLALAHRLMAEDAAALERARGATDPRPPGLAAPPRLRP